MICRCYCISLFAFILLSKFFYLLFLLLASTFFYYFFVFFSSLRSAKHTRKQKTREKTSFGGDKVVFVNAAAASSFRFFLGWKLKVSWRANNKCRGDVFNHSQMRFKIIFVYIREACAFWTWIPVKFALLRTLARVYYYPLRLFECQGHKNNTTLS